MVENGVTEPTIKDMWSCVSILLTDMSTLANVTAPVRQWVLGKQYYLYQWHWKLELSYRKPNCIFLQSSNPTVLIMQILKVLSILYCVAGVFASSPSAFIYNLVSNAVHAAGLCPAQGPAALSNECGQEGADCRDRPYDWCCPGLQCRGEDRFLVRC